MTVLEHLRFQHPELMKRFDRAPWDFKVFGPMGLEDQAIVVVYLYFGRKQCVSTAVIDMPLGGPSTIREDKPGTPKDWAKETNTIPEDPEKAEQIG